MIKNFNNLTKRIRKLTFSDIVITDANYNANLDSWKRNTATNILYTADCRSPISSYVAEQFAKDHNAIYLNLDCISAIFMAMNDNTVDFNAELDNILRYYNVNQEQAKQYLTLMKEKSLVKSFDGKHFDSLIQAIEARLPKSKLFVVDGSFIFNIVNPVEFYKNRPILVYKASFGEKASTFLGEGGVFYLSNKAAIEKYLRQIE